MHFIYIIRNHSFAYQNFCSFYTNLNLLYKIVPMSYHSFPSSFCSASDRLSCTPQNFCQTPPQARPFYNQQPRYYNNEMYNNRPRENPSCQMSKLANFVHYGGGNRQQAEHQFAAGRGQYRNQPPQNQYNPPPPVKPRNCCPGKNYAPPVFIESKPKGCNGKDGKGPAERLRNVDVLEELCYYVPGGDQSSSPMDCYNVCNCCGASELVDCGCENNGEKQPPNPVKYSRRQRFTFQGPEAKRNDFPPVPNIAPVWPFDNQPCKESNNSDDNPKAKSSCDKILPPETGVYYFDSKRRMFISQKDMPKPPEVVYADLPQSARQSTRQPTQPTRPAAPQIEEYEILEEERNEPEVVIQPIIQPIYMPSNNNNNCCNPCNPCCNPCNSYNRNNGCNPCNPCNNPCNPFMNNGMGGMGPCGPCIPLCIPMGPSPAPPQQQAPMMYPSYPPPPPPMYPPPFPFPPPQQKMKKKKKKEKKIEETVIDFEEAPSPSHRSPTSTYVINTAKVSSPASSGHPAQSSSTGYSSGYSNNIIVPGGPAELFGGGRTPEGATAVELESKMLVTTQDGVQTGGAITTIDFPPGQAQNIEISTNASESQFESNININADIGRGPTSPNAKNTSPGARNLSPNSLTRDKNGVETAIFTIPEGTDATIRASNDPAPMNQNFMTN